MLDQWWMLSTNEEYQYLHEKNICLYPKTMLRKRPKFWRESLRGVKLVKNFNMIQFGFSMMWRIMRILEAVITFSLICIILHIILSLIQ